MYVFRGGKSDVRADACAARIVRELRSIPADVHGDYGRDRLVDALVAAGELESGLADAAHDDTGFAEQAVDDLARALVRNHASPWVADAIEKLAMLASPAAVRVSAPEGFTYHGLHPEDYAELVRSMPLAAARACVIGIRSIGTTLSAVVTAALRERGIDASRSTVRPTGHPYRRETRFAERQERWLEAELARGATCLVVDEGPGISGSSFLSVGEALGQIGFEPSQVRFLCSRAVDPASLVAPDARLRWSRFDAHVARPGPAFARNFESLDSGRWRSKWFADEETWPAAWPMMERPKYLAADRKRIFKFEGLGPRGLESLARSAALAEAGYGPLVGRATRGFASYEIVDGRPMTFARVTESVLRRLSSYLALRSVAFAAEPHACDDLRSMLQTNLRREFPDVRSRVPELPLARPVVPDGRMLPHEWIEGRGTIWKTDGANHGDDQFFPGPTDIAWDLAGTILEWRLDAGARNFLLDAYGREAGDRPASRLDAYLLAYAVFRMAWCKMACASTDGVDAANLFREYARYRAIAETYLKSAGS